LEAFANSNFNVLAREVDFLLRFGWEFRTKLGRTATLLIRIFETKQAMGETAAAQAATILRSAIRDRGAARIVAATGASQFEFLDALTSSPGIDWPKVELFHLDEYIGLPMTHAASFCKYLQERLISKTGIIRHHLMNGEDDPAEVIRSTGEAIASAPIDVAFVGIGENAHLAFNDPPANFETDEPYLIVGLDEPCRRQQVGEGWFANLEAVPTRAISMSVRQILRAKEIVGVVPDARKAAAVKACIEGPIGAMVPASILRTHPNATIYLDRQSAALLSPATLAASTVSR
jgi:glucosamine-6-phosphate deaminase